MHPPESGHPSRAAEPRHRLIGAVAGVAAAAGLAAVHAVSAVATIATVAAVAWPFAAPSAISAAGANGTSFAEAFDRARLVVVATVVEAPPVDPGYLLSVEAVVKGTGATELRFAADATSVTLVPGTRVVVLAMDPRSLDFRGTWTLAVAPDGTIDPDGLTGAPRTVDELLATYGTAAPVRTAPGAGETTARSPQTTDGDNASADGATGGGAAPWLVGAASVAVVAVLVAAGIAVAARRRRRVS